mgnify:CR=1 FL=1
MVKYAIIFLALSTFLDLPAEAKNSVVIKVSCTIPKIVTLSKESKELKEKDSTVQYEEVTRNGKKIFLKTVVAK